MMKMMNETLRANMIPELTEWELEMIIGGVAEPTPEKQEQTEEHKNTGILKIK